MTLLLLQKTHLAMMSYKRATLNNARTGEAIGFLSESCGTIEQCIAIFPNNSIDPENLVKRLKDRDICAPYGQYNNNYLTPDNNQLIYSDDSEMTSIVGNVVARFDGTSTAESFASELATKFRGHWQFIKTSGLYGLDGLDYGKRGYSKSTLLALSELENKDTSALGWYIADNKFNKMQGNGSLLRSWIIGINSNSTEEKSYQFGYLQSLITHPDEDIAHCAGSLSMLFYILFKEKFASKRDVVIRLQSILEKKNNTSKSLDFLKLAIALYDDAKSFQEVFSLYHGGKYFELLLLVIFSFLYFDNFLDAMFSKVKFPGDNDSVLFVLGALFGGYDGQDCCAGFLPYIEDTSLYPL